MTEVTWPDRPTCHDGEGHADLFGPTTYRDPIRPDQVEIGYGWFSRRTCSYCGSIAPQDLYQLLHDLDACDSNGPYPRLHGADWKYGWPHKFYVDNMPLPRGWEGQRTPLSYRYENGQRTDVTWRDVVDDSGKFYSNHLRDLTPEAFALLAPLLHRHTGIKFEQHDGGLWYLCTPWVGDWEAVTSDATS